MPQLNTARGVIDTGDLGVTLMHEHVFVTSPEILDNYPADLGRRSRARGRRDQPAQRAQVARCGQHRGPDGDRAGALHPPHCAHRRGHRHQHRRRDGHVHLQRRADAFPLQGARHAAGRPGDHDRDVRRRHHRRHRRHRHQGGDPQVRHRRARRHARRRAGAAGRRTGAPPDRRADLDAYARPRPPGLEQQRIFAEEGVDLTRVVIGHCGDTTDIDYLEEIIGNGSYIGMDRFGLDTFLDTEQRVATVATMCERGHADKMVLSHDASCFMDWLPEGLVPAAMPNWHYLHIHNDVLPALKQRGVTDEQIHAMLVDNPRMIFEKQGGY